MLQGSATLVFATAVVQVLRLVVETNSREERREERREG